MPAIDREATKKRVEEYLETARLFKRYGLERRENRMTPAYSQRFHGPTNSISKMVESVAIDNITREQELEAQLTRAERCIAKLSKRQRDLINLKYMEDADVLDFNAAVELHMSERTYRRVKGTAIYFLAFMLNLEVYEEEIRQ